MQLSFKNLLYQLALEYNNHLVYSDIPRIYNKRLSYYQRQKKARDEYDAFNAKLRSIEDDIMLLSLLQEVDVLLEVDRPKVPRSPYKKRVYYWTNLDTGKRSVMTWKHTFWYNNYVINTQQHDSRWANKFCKRFRLPYSSFLDLVNLCSESKMFSQWS